MGALPHCPHPSPGASGGQGQARAGWTFWRKPEMLSPQRQLSAHPGQPRVPTQADPDLPKHLPPSSSWKPGRDKPSGEGSGVWLWLQGGAGKAGELGGRGPGGSKHQFQWWLHPLLSPGTSCETKGTFPVLGCCQDQRRERVFRELNALTREHSILPGPPGRPSLPLLTPPQDGS